MNSTNLKEDENYQIYNDGRIYSKYSNKFLSYTMYNGYYGVSLKSTKIKKTIRVHRLVALYFVPNNLNKKTVNHIDGDKLNNDYTNLEWTTQIENNVHMQYMYFGSSSRQKRAVCQYNDDNELITYFPSMAEASRQTGISKDMISHCCRNKVNSTNDKNGNKYIFKYKEESSQKIPRPQDARQIEGFDNYYITPDGKIYSEWYQQYLHTQINSDGYEYVTLKNKKKKRFQIHSLVAKYFIGDIGESNDQINHIDHNRANNNINNLEYVTASQNGHHKFINGRNAQMTRKIWQLDLDGNILNTYDSIADAARKNNLTYSSLGGAVQGRLKTLKGYRWQYFDTPILPLEPNKLNTRKVVVYYDDGISILFDSVKEAAKEYNMDTRRISDACKSSRKYKDHVFTYASSD